VDKNGANAWADRLAAFLCERRERIIEAWIAAVERDPQIPRTDSISRQQLRNHMPQMFDDLADTLRHDGEPETAPINNAEHHGRHRWEQNYELPQLLRELARVRVALDDEVSQFEEQHPEVSGEEKRRARLLLHFFFDEMVAGSTQQFVGRQQAELRARNEHLRALDAARLRLLRTTTHELRNALDASHLAAQQLAEQCGSGSASEPLGMLARNTGHMAQLVHDLLTYATLFDAANSPRLVSVRVDQLVEELVTDFRPQAEARRLRLTGKCDPALQLVTSDPTKLRQIGSNLISNALKYTEVGGIQLSARVVNPNQWALVVEDTGPGIAAEEQQQLFEEYFRSDRTAHLEGTGLGLSIVKRLVDLLQGEIRVVSELGRGSRFEVLLPREVQSVTH
jgi:signal transduction histidine kinase